MSHVLNINFENVLFFQTLQNWSTFFNSKCPQVLFMTSVTPDRFFSNKEKQKRTDWIDPASPLTHRARRELFSILSLSRVGFSVMSSTRWASLKCHYNSTLRSAQARIRMIPPLISTTSRKGPSCLYTLSLSRGVRRRQPPPIAHQKESNWRRSGANALRSAVTTAHGEDNSGGCRWPPEQVDHGMVAASEQVALDARASHSSSAPVPPEHLVVVVGAPLPPSASPPLDQMGWVDRSFIVLEVSVESEISFWLMFVV
jgi:hypothetical protein